MTNFDNAFADIIGVEGNETNDPKDPGGLTKFGIAKNSNPDVDVANLTLDDAKAIYKARYWDLVHGDDLKWPLCLFVFDCAVNQGADTAKKLLQKSAGTVQDGILGKNTLTSIGRADQRELCAMFMADRAIRYTGTRNFDTYGRGWMARLFRVTLEAQL